MRRDNHGARDLVSNASAVILAYQVQAAIESSAGTCRCDQLVVIDIQRVHVELNTRETVAEILFRHPVCGCPLAVE